MAELGVDAILQRKHLKVLGTCVVGAKPDHCLHRLME